MGIFWYYWIENSIVEAIGEYILYMDPHPEDKFLLLFRDIKKMYDVLAKFEKDYLVCVEMSLI